MDKYDISYEQIMAFFGMPADCHCTHMRGGGKRKFVSAFDKDHRCIVCGRKFYLLRFEKDVERLNMALESGKLKPTDSLTEIKRKRVSGFFDEPADEILQAINSMKDYIEKISKK